jgi:hypothetical protein
VALEAIIPLEDNSKVLASLMDVIEKRLYPSLERLTVWGDADVSDYIEALRDQQVTERCKKLGVQLLIYSNVSYYFDPEENDVSPVLL